MFVLNMYFLVSFPYAFSICESIGHLIHQGIHYRQCEACQEPGNDRCEADGNHEFCSLVCRPWYEDQGTDATQAFLNAH